ncbi:L,D-transpeptidase family protein [Hyphomicrobium sp.]|uniref:L,D-transpeptidase family protein n=1 Tax=Hyphomicrobium sp. TaxID=82 RepID=UPI002D7993D4|nr:L,D-transpeptidase family protein [Hyphomicrobium sp.]HET6390073.1 L,D-transpeptidase family protein [Hyphomicrobium sp.]
MNKSSLRLLGVSMLGVCLAGVPAAIAGPIIQNSPSGTTTYFAPPGTPATTGALPSADVAKDEATAAPSPTTPAPATPAAEAPAQPAPSTAAVTPPASEPPQPAPDVSQTPAAPAPETTPATATPTDTATEPKPEAMPTVAAPVAPPVSPVVAAARTALADKSLGGRNNVAEDLAAARDFYNTRTEPLWVFDGAYTRKAKAVISTLKSADDWGLEPADFPVPELIVGASPDAQGVADAQLTLSALKYARFARGGRLDPVALSNILDMKPPVKDAKNVINELASVAEPDAYLRGLNPKHEGFERLRQALLKARGPKQEEEAVDPALLVKLPQGKLLKPGAQDDQVVLLRQRLKVPASSPADESVYDDNLVDAVRSFQQDNGLKADGIVGNRVRAALNKAGEPKVANPKRQLDRLIANMERWRWLPVDLGPLYVMNNIPEFSSEIWKGNSQELKQRMIVGQPSWPTPVMSAKMQFVIFRPSWGMPDGIKAKELMPRLKSASGGSGFGFFDQLFGGGSSGGARVLQAYKLQVYYRGQPVDPDSVNWSTADIRQYSFTQPPGPDNPLGLVKFRFPNRHDVYMHDTPERGLFNQSNRALSHGCLRVEEPRRTAEVLLAEDKGYSPEKVAQLWDSGASVTLSKEVPVYLVYFTASVDNDGRLQTFSDIYGHDDRIMSALRGRPVRYTAPEAVDPIEANEPMASNSSRNANTFSDAGSDSMMDAPPPSKKNTKKSASAKQKQQQSKSSGGTIQDALSNIFLN